MKIAILGFGLQGQSAYKYWASAENEITICDQNNNLTVPENSKTKLGDDYLDDLEQFDLIVRSPSVHPDEIVKANSDEILKKVTTPTNEFFQVCPSKNIIGVTGTKGKGTTSALIAKMLQNDGKKVHIGGNIGTPPLEMLDKIEVGDYVVLELANFQLIDLKHSPPIAVCLMMAPEHLDWHKSKEEYYDSKKPLFQHQTTDDKAIYFAENDISKEIAAAGDGVKIPYYSPPGAFIDSEMLRIDDIEIASVANFKLLGKHNWQNICAATTAFWQISKNADAVKQTVESFSGMPYRLELIREIDGARYYNDSFGTTPETAIVAIEAFSEPKIVILGGSDKGSDYTQLAETVAKNNIKRVILIGEMADDIATALKKSGFDDIESGGETMDEIVEKARRLAAPGDVVLLSPACASFDMFKNYKDRGDQFTQAVLTLS